MALGNLWLFLMVLCSFWCFLVILGSIMSVAVGSQWFLVVSFCDSVTRTPKTNMKILKPTKTTKNHHEP